MPYQVTWYIENKLLLNRCWDELSLEDHQGFTAVIADHLMDALEQGHDKIPAIFNMSEVSRFSLAEQPPSDEHLRRAVSEMDQRVFALRRGFLVLVTSNHEIHRFISRINEIFIQPMATVQTMNEALSILQNMYPELRETMKAQEAQR
jgi:hypothetical protein